MEDKKITCEFAASELFQIHLALISRNAFATQKWASASSADEQKQMASEISFLDELTKKVIAILSENEAEGKN